MSYLVVAATALECAKIADGCGIKISPTATPGTLIEGSSLSFLVSGVGQMQTAYWLSTVLSQANYTGVLNVGIAGSFSQEIGIASVVRVDREILADLGAEESGTIKNIFELELLGKNNFPFKDGALHASECPLFGKVASNLRGVTSVTLNKVLGEEVSIATIRDKYAPEIANMEGAAVFYACAVRKIPCLQIRAISDYVAPRDKSAWNIKGAVDSLSIVADSIINELIS